MRWSITPISNIQIIPNPNGMQLKPQWKAHDIAAPGILKSCIWPVKRSCPQTNATAPSIPLWVWRLSMLPEPDWLHGSLARSHTSPVDDFWQYLKIPLADSRIKNDNDDAVFVTVPFVWRMARMAYDGLSWLILYLVGLFGGWPRSDAPSWICQVTPMGWRGVSVAASPRYAYVRISKDLTIIQNLPVNDPGSES